MRSIALVFLVACGDQGTSSDSGADASAPTDSPSGADVVLDSPAAMDGATDAGVKNGQSLVWLWNDYPASLAMIAANKSSFTHVSPTLYDINYDYQSGIPRFTTPNGSDNFMGIGSVGITQQVHAAGLKCTPLIFGGAGNSGTDQGIHNILDDMPQGAQSSFMSTLVAEAKAKGYDGYNLDWEVDTQTTGAAYAQKLETFLGKFKAALNAQGLTLSIDLGTWYLQQSYCSGGNGYVDLTAIAANVDMAILMDYTAMLGTASTMCPNSIPNPQTCGGDFVSALNLMCVYVMPSSKISIGLNANATMGNNPIAGASISTIEAYKIHNVAIWPDYNTDGPNGKYVFLDAKSIVPANATWYSLLADFLAAQ